MPRWPADAGRKAGDAAVRESRLEAFRENGYEIYRVPSIVCTARGTLLVCYECRYGGDWSAMDLALRRSEDGGRTWSERKIIASGQTVDAIHNGILFAEADRVHLLWHRNYRQAFCATSMDDGLTWSRPREITAAYDALRAHYPWTVIAAGPGHGLTAASGRLLIPVWVAANRADITSHHPSVATTLFSDDHGETWRCGELIPAREDFVDPNESVLAQLSDGSFMINCRHETATGCRKVGYSPDGIGAWNGFHWEPQLPDPVCCAGMTQHDARLWFVNCACQRGEGRVRLTIRESRDDGATWPKQLEIAALGGYSDVAYRPDTDTLHVIAETGRATEDTFSFGISVFHLATAELGNTPQR